MKINHNKSINEKYELEFHFFINISVSDVEKHGDDIFEKAAEEFVKYAKEARRDRWYNIESTLECEECLSKGLGIIIESEKYVKEQ